MLCFSVINELSYLLLKVDFFMMDLDFQAKFQTAK